MTRAAVAVVASCALCSCALVDALRGNHNAGSSDGGGGDAVSDGSVSPGGAVYVAGANNQIYEYALDTTTFALGAIGTTVVTAAPTYLALDPNSHWIVALTTPAGIQSFSINAQTGALSHVASGSSGPTPTYIGVDNTGGWVFVANTGDNSIAAIPILSDGTLGDAVTTQTGFAAPEQLVESGTGVGYVPFSSGGVSVYTFSPDTGAFTIQNSVEVGSGDDPYRIVVSDAKMQAWVLTEMTSEIIGYNLAADGGMNFISEISSRDTSSGSSSGGDLLLHPSGNWLYASNRGDNTITQFEIESDGSLTFVRAVPSGGSDPRQMSFALDGALLLVADGASNTIFELQVDPSGKLTTGASVAMPQTPLFVGQLLLP